MRANEAEANASTARTEAEGWNLSGAGSGAEAGTAAVGRTKPEALRLMEAAVERSNMLSGGEEPRRTGSRWSDGGRVQALA